MSGRVGRSVADSLFRPHPEQRARASREPKEKVPFTTNEILLNVDQIFSGFPRNAAIFTFSIFQCWMRIIMSDGYIYIGFDSVSHGSSCFLPFDGITYEHKRTQILSYCTVSSR